MRIVYLSLILCSLVFILNNQVFAQKTALVKPAGVNQNSSCIDESEIDKLNFVKKTQCFEDRTFSEINARKPRVPKTTDLPSCEEMVHFTHQVDMESKSLPIKEFDKKYTEVVKDKSRQPLSINHPFFDKSKAPKPNNTLTREENVLLDLMAMEASKDITHKLQAEIKLYGLEKAKAKFKDVYGLKAQALLNIDSPEAFLREFTADKVKSIFVKQVAEPSVLTKISIESLSQMTSKISSKTWLKESIVKLKDPLSSKSISL
jgi:hypothetical protein